MKKLIKSMAIIISAITMAMPTYGMTSQDFNATVYTSDNKILSTTPQVSSITLSDSAYSLLSTEDWVYVEYHSSNSGFSNIYRCSNDLKEQTFVASIPPLAYIVCYYDNSIYYINPVVDDYSVNEICSLNLETKAVTKHITYTGDINLFGINNGYMYFETETSFPLSTKIYRQSINNTSDKKLIYYSSKNSIYDYKIGENKLYISNLKSTDVIDLKTGKIVNSYKGYYEILGEYNGRLYLFNEGVIYKALENNIAEAISDNVFDSSKNLHPLLMSGSKIQFTAYDYNIYTYYRYEYNIDSNEWTLLASYIY